MLQTQPFFTTYSVIIVTVAMLFFVIFFYLFIIQLHSRRIIHQKEMFDLTTQYEQTILLSQIEIQEQTFRNISQEIHDNIGQALSLAKLNLNTIPSGDSSEKIALTEEMLGQAINDLRDLSHSLHTEKISDIGLAQAINHELVIIEKAARIKTTLIQENGDLILNKDKIIIIFRMIQEMLHNAIKHAKATEIIVKLTTENEGNVISVRDNGTGFDIGKLNIDRVGIGLKSIAQRCKLIDVQYCTNSIIGNGTEVRIIIKNDKEFI